MNYKAIVITTVVVLGLCLTSSVTGIVLNELDENSRRYDITYVLNGGTNSDENPSSYRYNTEVTFSDPTYEGYIFTGWYSDSGLTERMDSIGKGTNQNVTVYAGWEISLVGKSLTFSITGTMTSGNSSYPLTSLMTIDYLNYSKDHGYQVRNESSTEIDFTSYKYRGASTDTSWDDEDTSTFTEGSRTTIDTIFGTKDCTTWTYTKDKSTEVQYVGDDNIVYLVEYTEVDGNTTTEMTCTLVGINDPSKSTLVRNYTWNYKGVQYDMTLNIAHTDFVGYRTSDITRSQGTNDHDRRFVTSDDAYVRQIAARISQLSAGMTDADKAGMILAFTQYIQYQYDQQSVGRDEYWKYPVETLVDHEGDCEDTSILFCAIAKQMGFDCCMILYPGHMAAGISVAGCTGSGVYTFHGKDYYYCETTAVDWAIGHAYGAGCSPSDVSRHIIV